MLMHIHRIRRLRLVVRKVMRKVIQMVMRVHYLSTTRRIARKCSRKSPERNRVFSHWKISMSPWNFVSQRSIVSVHYQLIPMDILFDWINQHVRRSKEKLFKRFRCVCFSCSRHAVSQSKNGDHHWQCPWRSDSPHLSLLSLSMLFARCNKIAD